MSPGLNACVVLVFGVALSVKLPSEQESGIGNDIVYSVFDGAQWYLRDATRTRDRPELTWAPRRWRARNGCPEPAEGAKSYSQDDDVDIDLYNKYFCGVRNGTYVEIGALDGYKFSNTKFFDEFMGWSGALIEAAPSNARRLSKNRGGNPNNVIFGEGVCPEGVDHMDFLVADKDNVGGDPNAMSAKFKEHWHRKSSTVSVPCRPLGQMLRETLTHVGTSHIDFFSLDVEGGELVVLQTMDWNVRVKVWVIELDGTDMEKDEGVRQLLFSHGYNYTGFHHGRNEWFTGAV